VTGWQGTTSADWVSTAPGSGPVDILLQIPCKISALRAYRAWLVRCSHRLKSRGNGSRGKDN
jgi:hypothetical protein